MATGICMTPYPEIQRGKLEQHINLFEKALGWPWQGIINYLAQISPQPTESLYFNITICRFFDYP